LWAGSTQTATSVVPAGATLAVGDTRTLAGVRITASGAAAAATGATAAIGATGVELASGYACTMTIATDGVRAALPTGTSRSVISTGEAHAVRGALAQPADAAKRLRAPPTGPSAAVIAAASYASFNVWIHAVGFATLAALAVFTEGRLLRAHPARSPASIASAGAFVTLWDAAAFALQADIGDPTVTHRVFRRTAFAASARSSASIVSTELLLTVRATNLVTLSRWTAEIGSGPVTSLTGSTGTSASIVSTLPRPATGGAITPAVTAGVGGGTRAADPSTSIRAALFVGAVRLTDAESVDAPVSCWAGPTGSSTPVRSAFTVDAIGVTATGVVSATPVDRTVAAGTTTSVVSTRPADTVWYAGGSPLANLLGRRHGSASLS